MKELNNFIENPFGMMLAVFYIGVLLAIIVWYLFFDDNTYNK